MFNKARLTLTTWYLLIIMCVSLFFSMIIYKVQVDEVERFARIQQNRIEQKIREEFLFNAEVFPPPVIFKKPIESLDLVKETKQRIIGMLTIINLWIFFFAGGLGYLLSGLTLKPISEMIQEQNRFITDASHEFKTPLTVLKTSFEVHLRNNKRTEDDADILIRESIAEVNKLQVLSDKLFEMITHENFNDAKPMETLDVQTVLGEAIQNVSSLAKKNQNTLHVKLFKQNIKGNKQNLIHLFVILIDNAIKYSNKKNPIEIQMIKKGRRIGVSIKDQGIGIDKKDIHKIFDRFYRADQSRSKIKTDGYGLGLSIAKRIIEQHNGTISVHSTPGKGTEFTVWLPTRN